MKTIAELSGVRAHLLYRKTKQVSGFESWDQRPRASAYLLYGKNLGPRLSIDEVSLSQGDLYTY